MNNKNTTTILNERNQSLKTGKHVNSVFSISDNLFMVSQLLSTITQIQYDFSFLLTLICPRRSLIVAIAQECRIKLSSRLVWTMFDCLLSFQ